MWIRPGQLNPFRAITRRLDRISALLTQQNQLLDQMLVALGRTRRLLSAPLIDPAAPPPPPRRKYTAADVFRAHLPTAAELQAQTQATQEAAASVPLTRPSPMPFDQWTETDRFLAGEDDRPA